MVSPEASNARINAPTLSPAPIEPAVQGEAHTCSGADHEYPVESRKPLFQSILWRWLKIYYEQAAQEAWALNQVPMFVTSNTRLCRHYAILALNFMRDYYASNPSSRQKVYVLEAGGGHGRFSFMFLRHILKFKDAFEQMGMPEKPFLFIFSDISMNIINGVSSHGSLQQLVEDGWLDFAMFDVNKPDLGGVELIKSKCHLIQGSPVIVVANYVIDSLLTDSWQIVPKCLPEVQHQTLKTVRDSRSWTFLASLSSEFQETTDFRFGEEPLIMSSLLSVNSAQQESDLEDLNITSRMSLKWDWQPVRSSAILMDPFIPAENSDTTSKGEVDHSKLFQERPPSYLTPSMVAILRKYVEEAEYSGKPFSFTFPIGGMRLTSSLYSFTEGNMLMLIGDKGYSNTDEFKILKNPHIAIHGAISFMTNLHCLKLYTNVLGGSWFATPYADTFQVTVLWAGSKFPNFRASLTDLQFELVPDSVIAWQRAAVDQEAQSGALSLREVLSLIRFSCHDPDVFLSLRKSILHNCVPPLVSIRTEPDIYRDCLEVYQNWYRINYKDDLPDLLAQVCMRLGRMRQAIFFFKESLEKCPETVHPAPYVNMASCYKVLGNIEKAMECVQSALDLKPDFVPALKCKAQLEMCGTPINVAVLGCGSWTFSSVMGLLMSDKRCSIKMLWAFEAQAALAVKHHFKLDQTEVLSGAAALQAIVDSEQIEAVVFDAPAILWSKLLPKFWNCSKPKHVFSQRVYATSFSAADLRALIAAYQVAYLAQGNSQKPLWFVMSNEEFDDFVSPAALAPIGQPRAFSAQMQFKENSIRDSQLSQATLSAAMDCLATALEFTRSDVSQVCARMITQAGIQQILGHSDETICTASASPHSQLTAGNIEADGNRPNLPCGMTGWVSLALNRDSLRTDGSQVPSFSNQPAILGTFNIGTCTGEGPMKLTLIGSEGTMSVEKTHSAWKVTSRCGEACPTVTESGKVIISTQMALDTFISQMHQIKRAGKERGLSSDPLFLQTAERLNNFVNHTTIHHALAESAEKNGLCIQFSYVSPLATSSELSDSRQT